MSNRFRRAMATRDGVRRAFVQAEDIESEALAATKCELGEHGLWCYDPAVCPCQCHALAFPCHASSSCHYPLCACSPGPDHAA